MVLAVLVRPVEKVNEFSFPLNVFQSAKVNAPLFIELASGKLNVCIEPEDEIIKLLPAVPIAKVCTELVNPLIEVIALPVNKLENVLVVTLPKASDVKTFVFVVLIPIPSNRTSKVV